MYFIFSISTLHIGAATISAWSQFVNGLIGTIAASINGATLSVSNAVNSAINTLGNNVQVDWVYEELGVYVVLCCNFCFLLLMLYCLTLFHRHHLSVPTWMYPGSMRKRSFVSVLCCNYCFCYCCCVHRHHNSTSGASSGPAT